jgi:hypothetical protein
MRIRDGMRIGLSEGVNRAVILRSWAPAVMVTMAVGRALLPLMQGADLLVLWRLA